MSDDIKLPAEAQAAWNAYQVMGKSKVEYFGLLQEIDQKYKQGGSPSIAENLQLEKLLTTHSEKVAAFNAAMQAVTDKEARELLLKKLMGGASPPGMH
jgi:hypothetical protein